jgi:hypothetical protein
VIGYFFLGQLASRRWMGLLTLEKTLSKIYFYASSVLTKVEPYIDGDNC